MSALPHSPLTKMTHFIDVIDFIDMIDKHGNHIIIIIPLELRSLIRSIQKVFDMLKPDPQNLLLASPDVMAIVAEKRRNDIVRIKQKHEGVIMRGMQGESGVLLTLI